MGTVVFSVTIQAERCQRSKEKFSVMFALALAWWEQNFGRYIILLAKVLLHNFFEVFKYYATIYG